MMNHHFKTLVIFVAVTGYLIGFAFWEFAEAKTYHYVAPEFEKIEMIVPDQLPHESMFAEISAYTSSVDETDDTPNINAQGTKPGPGSIACPSRYPFGTKVFIKTKTYVCDDRMNRRYSSGDYFDIWMETKPEAIHWGRRTVEVEVLLSK